MESIIFEATAEAETLYVPEASADCTSATLSVRTPSSALPIAASLPALLKVA
jgi:hypothetical protein